MKKTTQLLFLFTVLIPLIFTSCKQETFTYNKDMINEITSICNNKEVDYVSHINTYLKQVNFKVEGLNLHVTYWKIKSYEPSTGNPVYDEQNPVVYVVDMTKIRSYVIDKNPYSDVPESKILYLYSL